MDEGPVSGALRPAPVDAALERLLRRDRLLVIAMLAAATAAAWTYIIAGAGLGMPGAGMHDPGSMAGMDMGTKAGIWTPAYALLMLVMWWVMMAAMMLPTAAPMILLFAAIERRRTPRGPHVPTALFVAGYLLVWCVFGVFAVTLQSAASAAAVVGAEMAVTPAALAGGLLVAAGLYQLTPIKQTCLRQCRDPARFLAAYWRPGRAGALRMGLAHGGYCLGCCWFLMLLLFVGGVMNLAWIGGLALFVLMEKLVSAGHRLSQAAGLALIAVGSWMVTSALSAYA